MSLWENDYFYDSRHSWTAGGRGGCYSVYVQIAVANPCCNRKLQVLQTFDPILRCGNHLG